MLEYLAAVLAVLVVVVLFPGMVYPPFWRDLYTLYVSYGVMRRVKQSYKSHKFVIDQFEQQVLQRPKEVFIRFKEDTLTYEYVDLQATKVARTLIELDISPGDTLALVMSNEPAFVWIYLGAQKIGARIALVNHHLVSDALRHSISSCAPKLVIVGDGLEDYLPERVSTLEPTLEVPIYCYNKAKPPCNLPSFSDLMAQMSSDPVNRSVRSSVKWSDPCSFIFTSGTTGLPKPAIISQKKAILCSHCFGPVGFKSSDVMYLTLPLYHASALNLALLNVISVGATIVIREKFSTSQFWSDCCKYEVTCFQYIGEMLRYLVNTPEKPEEKQHKVWAAIGNGLRPDIWDRFKSRFAIKNIYEFYGSTELPASFTNLFNVPGSVGRLSPLLSEFMKQILVKIDPETRQPCRHSDGRCERITAGNSGVLLAKLSERVSFDGYLGPAKDTSSRIIKNVLEDGDFYVNTNDVFMMDGEYNLFFTDRIGDSFRWKGENVSTAEVSNVMNSASFVQDTNVFGVEIPGCEGKAGMAAINLKENEELDDGKVQELGKLCRQKLPGYARPRFLRFQRQMSLTSTFKQQKTDLAKESYNPSVVDEPLYYLDRASDQFRPLNTETFHEIEEGHLQM